MNKDHADSALNLFADVAGALGLKWFLFAGTCLGLYRDGGYIEGDNDIDVGVEATEDELTQLWDALDVQGFKLGRWCENTDGTKNRHTYWHPEVAHPDAGGMLVDVFYTFTEGEQNFLVNLGQITYGDRNYLVPYPVQDYLQHTYENWWEKTDRKAKEGVPSKDVGLGIPEYGLHVAFSGYHRKAPDV